MISELVKKNRSYRNFLDIEVNLEDIRYALMNARLSPSAFNVQSLRYKIIMNKDDKLAIVNHVVWAGLEPKQDINSSRNPPGAFILIFNDNSIIKNTYVGCNLGIAAQTICLSLVEKGYRTCMLQSFSKDYINKLLGLEEKYDLLLIIAIGYSKEKIGIRDIHLGESTRYYTKDEIHYVPKILLDDIII